MPRKKVGTRRPRAATALPRERLFAILDGRGGEDSILTSCVLPCAASDTGIGANLDVLAGDVAVAFFATPGEVFPHLG